MNRLKAFFLSLETYTIPNSIGLLILRVLIGLSLSINHGWGAFSSLLSGEIDYPDPLGIGSLTSKAMMSTSEFACALFVVAGLFTRITAIPIVIGFSVALFIYHNGDPFQHKELAYLYWTTSLVILCCGPGSYSLDKFILKKRTQLH